MLMKEIIMDIKNLLIFINVLFICKYIHAFKIKAYHIIVKIYTTLILNLGFLIKFKIEY